MFIEGTEVVFIAQPSEVLGFGTINTPCQVRKGTALLTVVGEQFPETHWPEFAQSTISALYGIQSCVEIVLDVEEGIRMSRAPEKGM